MAARDANGAVAAWTLAVVIAGAGLLVVTSDADSFDAGKRLLTLAGLVLAAGATLFGAPPSAAREAPIRLTAMQRVALLGLLAALAWTAAATLGAPRRAIAFDAARTVTLLATALPLGASRALAGRRRVGLLVVLVAVAAINAVTSVLQSWGLELFAVAEITGRSDTGAFLGNEGYLAQVLALALAATSAVAIAAPSAPARPAAILAAGLLLAGLLVTRNLTALVTLAAGAFVALALTHGRRALAAIALVMLVMAASVVAYAPFRGRLVDVGRAARAGDWDALTTNRLGPWAAGVEMVRERPLVGFGPGTFGAEFMAHRLAAELRWRHRLVIPLLTSNFGEAHNEYLQAAAEGGVPVLLAVLVAVGALLAGLTRIAVDAADARRGEAVVLVAVLVAAAVASLTWFPLQRPMTAVPLLLAAGRGWRLIGEEAA